MLDIYVMGKSPRKIFLSELPKIKRQKIWVDSTNITSAEADLLRKTFKLHPLTSEDLVHKNIHIKIEQFPNYLFASFFGLHEKAEMISLDFVIGKRFLISNHSVNIDSTKALKESMDKTVLLIEKGTDFLMHRIIDMEVDNLFPVLAEQGEKILKIEKKVIKQPRADTLQELFKIRHTLNRIRKTSIEQREKMSVFTRQKLDFISKGALPYFRDVYDHTVRATDMIEGYREDVANAYDVYMSTVSNNMNEVMKVLSIIATIALPLTVISGIYGTNFINLPGSKSAAGFWWMILGMVLLCTFMLMFFRKRGWF